MHKTQRNTAKLPCLAVLGASILLLPLALLLLVPVFCIFCLALTVKGLRAPKNSLARKTLSLRGLGLRFIVLLRYSLVLRGLDKIEGEGPFLFLSNHPSLMDPFLLYSCLDGIRPRFVADENQFTSALLRWVKGLTKVITIPDYSIAGPKARTGLLRGLEEAGQALADGDHIALFPAGFMQKTQPQKLSNNSSVSRILQLAPQARIVAVRVSGMWGSSFSRAAHGGKKPDLMEMLTRGLVALLCNLLLFTPRRRLSITFEEAGPEAALAATATGAATRRDFTAWLEAYFNYACQPARMVPYYFWQGAKPRLIEEYTTASAADESGKAEH